MRSTSRRAIGLRSRLYRALAVLFVVVVAGGIANLGATHVMVGNLRQTAERVDREASLLARLRADIAPHAILLTGMDFDRVPALQASIRAQFADGIATSHLRAVR